MKITPIEELDEHEHYDDPEVLASPGYEPATPAQSIADPAEVLEDMDLDFNMEPAPAAEPQADEDSTQAGTEEPPQAPSAMSSSPPTAPPSAIHSRRSSIRVDEAHDGRLEANIGPMRRESRGETRHGPYPFSSTIPSLPPPPSTSSSYLEVVSFDESRTRHCQWTNGSDGALWWWDRRLEKSGITPLGPSEFLATEAEGSYSFADRAMYITKAKPSPGQVEYATETPKHKKAFDEARRKEVKSLLDNKAIRILSVEESRAFRQNHPESILQSRWVDRWKPSGDGKFSTLPEGFDEESSEPMNHPGLSAKSRW